MKRTETEFTAILLNATKSGYGKSGIVKKMKLNSKSVDRYIARSVQRGMLIEKDGSLKVSRKGERFLLEYEKFQQYKQEYLRRLKMLKEMLPTTRTGVTPGS